MRLSKKGEYAVRALVEIGLRSQVQKHALHQISTIAKATAIPEKFLEQILLALKNGGVLKSKRGVAGGYCLNKDIASITLGEIIRLMDGPLAPIPCVSKTAYEKCNCPDEETCGLRIAMQKARDSLSELLDSYTLALLLGEVQSKKAGSTKGWQFDI